MTLLNYFFACYTIWFLSVALIWCFADDDFFKLSDRKDDDGVIVFWIVSVVFGCVSPLSIPLIIIVVLFFLGREKGQNLKKEYKNGKFSGILKNRKQHKDAQELYFTYNSMMKSFFAKTPDTREFVLFKQEEKLTSLQEGVIKMFEKDEYYVVKSGNEVRIVI